MTVQQTRIELDQEQDLFLSIYKPSILFSCQVDGSYNKSSQSITYKNGSGDITKIVDGLFQVALVGNAIGDDAKGRTYVRSYEGSTLRFLESDHINFEDNDYITIIDFTEIIPLFPRIIQNPNDELDVIFYKIWDTEYANQNAALGAWHDIGSHYAGFLDPASGLASIYYTSSGTSSLINENLSYGWVFEGASSITGSTSAHPGYVQYDTPGHYKTVFMTSGSSGGVDTSVRYVSIYNHPHSSTGTLPYINWQFSGFNGSRDAGAFTAEIQIWDSVPENEIYDGALVVIFSEDYYAGDTTPTLYDDIVRSSIKFVGYIVEGTIKQNFKEKSTIFSVASSERIMELCEGFSVSVEDSAAPDVWYKLQHMTIEKAIYHYLRWHSTVLNNCSFRYTAPTRAIQYFDADRTSLKDAIKTLMSGAIIGNLVADRQSRIWAEQELSAVDNADTAVDVILNVDSTIWLNEPLITEKQYGDKSWLEVGGIAYSGATGTFSAYLCSAPGNAPRYRGKLERIQGLALLDQNDLNSIAGNILASENARYPAVDIALKRWADIDIAPQKLISLTTAEDETNRGAIFTNKKFVIQSISYQFQPGTQIIIPTLTLKETTQGFDAETILIPDVPPTEGYGQGNVRVPSIPSISVPATGGGGTLAIYHNGVFVAFASQINFIDDECV